MNFLKIPNLPDKPVKFAVIDKRASERMTGTLASLGIKFARTARHPALYDAVAYHPDTVIHHVRDNVVVYAPGTDDGFIKALRQLGFNMVMGATELGRSYPSNIAYNAARVGRYVFHNLKHTDPVLLKELEKASAEPVHVNQGYTKCSVSIVDSNSIITSDRGIAQAAEKKGIDVLLADPEEGILLPGLSSGFIGGASGLVSAGDWLISGELSRLKSARGISDFLAGRNISIISVPQEEVVDYGSILPLLTE